MTLTGDYAAARVSAASRERALRARWRPEGAARRAAARPCLQAHGCDTATTQCTIAVDAVTQEEEAFGEGREGDGTNGDYKKVPNPSFGSLVPWGRLPRRAHPLNPPPSPLES